MLKLILIADFAMLMMDKVTVSELRHFLLDFLRSRKNKKAIQELYNQQNGHGKITLDFIQPRLRRYQKQFAMFHRIYKAVLYTLIPQYLIIIACNVLLEGKSIYAVGFFFAVKLLIGAYIRSYQDASRVSVFRKNGK